MLPTEVLERIGPPPTDKPLKLARWWTSLLSEITWRLVGGQSSMTKLLREVRGAAGAAGKVLPHDIIFAAARKVNEDDDEMKAEGDGGPDEVELEEEHVEGRARAVRRDPSRG